MKTTIVDGFTVRYENGYMECGKYYAERFYQSHGATFSGWIVRHESNPYDVSDPIYNRKEALRILVAAERGDYR